LPYYGIRERGLVRYLNAVPSAHPLDAALQPSARSPRTLSLGGAPVRQHHERDDDRRHLLVIAPLLFPVVIAAVGPAHRLIQAYIFSMLAMVFIAAAVAAGRAATPTQRTTGRRPRQEQAME
jgi:F-type H+-transporting ATPase subunit a